MQGRKTQTDGTEVDLHWVHQGAGSLLTVLVKAGTSWRGGKSQACGRRSHQQAKLIESSLTILLLNQKCLFDRIE
jgi:hypothetical protein